jgi:hypothetical protein
MGDWFDGHKTPMANLVYQGGIMREFALTVSSFRKDLNNGGVQALGQKTTRKAGLKTMAVRRAIF